MWTQAQKWCKSPHSVPSGCWESVLQKREQHGMRTNRSMDTTECRKPGTDRLRNLHRLRRQPFSEKDSNVTPELWLSIYLLVRRMGQSHRIFACPFQSFTSLLIPTHILCMLSALYITSGLELRQASSPSLWTLTPSASSLPLQNDPLRVIQNSLTQAHTWVLCTVCKTMRNMKDEVTACFSVQEAEDLQVI